MDDKIRVWQVTVRGGVDEAKGATFEDMDIALAYLGAELREGSRGATLESELVDWQEYVRRVDAEEGGA